MAATPSTNRIIEAFKAAQGAASGALAPYGYEQKSSGTKNIALSADQRLDTSLGYWHASTNVSSKPPRWVVHLDATGPALAASFATFDGEPLTGAFTTGYINNGKGNCVLASTRLMPAVKIAEGEFQFPPGWEWILMFAFDTPLPVGSAAEALADFSITNGTVSYQGKPRAIGLIALIKTFGGPPADLPSGAAFSYDEATEALASWLGSGPAPFDVLDPASATDMPDLQEELANVFASAAPPAAEAVEIIPSPLLSGIPDSVYRLINAAVASNKRHFVFHGPPGTGKTTLAQYVAEQLASEETREGDDGAYTLLTGSSAWSSHDLVGGYQPLGPGRMGFIPGALLKAFDKPIIIDELNRCPIDKVIGPLFSVLSGQATTLPYRMDITDADSPCYRIFPVPQAQHAEHEFAPGPHWAMLCTLNQVDKTQLEQISFALSRRFTWIRIGIPEDPPAFVRHMLAQHNLLRGANDATLPNPVASMWAAVNEVRELGGAPVIDFLKLAAGMDAGIDFLAMPNGSAQETFVLVMASTFLPLLDGISRTEAETCAARIISAWGLGGFLASDVAQRFRELAP